MKFREFNPAIVLASITVAATPINLIASDYTSLAKYREHCKKDSNFMETFLEEIHQDPSINCESENWIPSVSKDIDMKYQVDAISTDYEFRNSSNRMHALIKPAPVSFKDTQSSKFNTSEQVSSVRSKLPTLKGYRTVSE